MAKIGECTVDIVLDFKIKLSFWEALKLRLAGAKVLEEFLRKRIENISLESDLLEDDAYIERLVEKISEAVEDKNVRLVASITDEIA